MNGLTQPRNAALRKSVSAALARSGWDVKAAAADLEIHRTYLHRLIKRFSLVRPAHLLALRGGTECSGVFVATDIDAGWVEVEINDSTTYRFSVESGRAIRRKNGKPHKTCPWRIDRSRIPTSILQARAA